MMKNSCLSRVCTVVAIPIAAAVALPVSAAPAATPAPASLGLATCTGGMLAIGVDPGLLLLEAREVGFSGAATKATCSIPLLETATVVSLSGHGVLSCLQNVAVPVSGNVEIEWGNHSASTVALDTFLLDLENVATLQGHVTGGRFAGELVTFAVVWTDADDAACNQEPGLQHLAGPLSIVVGI